MPVAVSSRAITHDGINLLDPTAAYSRRGKTLVDVALSGLYAGLGLVAVAQRPCEADAEILAAPAIILEFLVLGQREGKRQSSRMDRLHQPAMAFDQLFPVEGAWQQHGVAFVQLSPLLFQ